MVDRKSQKRVKAGNKKWERGFSQLNADFIHRLHRRLSRRLSLTDITNRCFFLFVFNLNFSTMGDKIASVIHVVLLPFIISEGGG